MSTTIKTRIIRLILATSIILFVSVAPAVQTVLASPVCGPGPTGC